MSRNKIDFLIGVLLFCLLPIAVYAQNTQVQATQNPSPGVGSILTSASPLIQVIASGSIIFACAAIIIGGLVVFNLHSKSPTNIWGPISVQSLGTIFFFPTLILLAIYLDLPKDAVTTILGAFLGYLFGRGGGNSPDRNPSDKPDTSKSGQVLDPKKSSDGGTVADDTAKSNHVTTDGDDLDMRNQAVANREAELASREAAVTSREVEVASRRAEVVGRETQAAKREQAIAKREWRAFKRGSHTGPLEPGYQVTTDGDVLSQAEGESFSQSAHSNEESGS
jgi:hypothetical protein